MRTKPLFLMALSLAALSACQSDDDNPVNPIEVKERRDIPLTRSEEVLTDKTIDFSLALFSQICRQEENKNLLISPLGAATLLNLTANGADGNTAAEIYNALSPDGHNAQEMNDFYAKLIDWLPELDNTTTVAQAYSVWTDKRFDIKSAYTDFAKSTFDAEVNTIDIGDPQGKQRIDQWCADNTGGNIKEMDFELTSFMMLHALHFKGTWKGKFDESATREEKFYGTDRTSTVQMMHNDKLAVRYAANDDLQVLLLPYGNEAYSMGIVLPGEGVSIRQAGQSLAADWKKLADKTVSLQVDLKLPKFKLVYETSLIEAAQALGIKDAFLSVADFSKLTDSDLYITLFKQKSLIDVDEKGTEASSVTIIGGDTSPGPGDTPEASTIVVDHPFLFFIQEKSTGLMLFMGKIENL